MGGNAGYTSTGSKMWLATTGSLSTSSQGVLWGASNDGAGTGLDADLLDGQHGSYYYAASNPNGYTNDQTAAEIKALLVNGLAATHLMAGSVGASEIGNDVVNSQHYAAGSIDNEHIADNAINSEHYADGSIDNAHIADNAINSEHYADGSIDRAHLAADIIDGTKIANDVINSEHYASNSIDALHLNVSGNGTTSQFLRSDADGTFTWATPTDTNTVYTLPSNVVTNTNAYNITTRPRFSANQSNNWDTIATASGSQGSLEIYNTGSGNDAFIAFHAGGDYAGYFGLDADTNDLAWGGWSVGASKHRIFHAGNSSQFTSALNTKLGGIATSANNYVLPTTITGTRNFSGLISANAGLRLGDGDKIDLGDSQDLEIQHYSVGQITNKTGDLYISSTAANTDIIFYAAIGATPTEFYRMNGGTGKNTFSRPVDISANLTATGDVGIGTTSPTELLHVRKAQSTSAATDPFIKLQPTSTTNSTGLTTIFLGCTTASSAYGISLSGWRDPTNSEAFAIKTHSGSANGTDRFVIRKNGYIGVGTSSPSSKLQVVGTLTATTKNFLIDNPKTGGELQYSVIESNEHGVSVRGESDQEEIQLPDEWEWLVHEDSVTVHLTSIDQVQHLFVLERNNIRVRVGGIATNGQYSYVISGTRKDVDPLEVHI